MAAAVGALVPLRGFVAAHPRRRRQPRRAVRPAARGAGDRPCARGECGMRRRGVRAHPTPPPRRGPAPVMDCLVSLAESGGRRDIRAVRQRLVARYGHDGELQAEEDRLRSQVDVPASGRRWWPLRLPPRRRCRGEGGDRGGRRCAVGASSGRRRAGSPPLRPETPRGAARRGAARRGLGRRGGHDDEGAAVRDHAARRSGRPGQRGDSAGVDGRGFPAGSGDGAAAGLRCRCHPGGAGQRRRGSRSRAPGAALHRGAGQGAVAAGRRLHVPGCTAPAAWSDAHHLWHWADGGPSDVDNAALLCGRHHTVVHTKGYFASVVEGQVVWDLRPGAYDQWLAAVRRGGRPRRGRPPPDAVRPTDTTTADPTTADDHGRRRPRHDRRLHDGGPHDGGLRQGRGGPEAASGARRRPPAAR